MPKAAPLTRLAAALAVSIWAFLLQASTILCAAAALMLLLLMAVSGLKKGGRVAFGLGTVATFLVGLQYILGTDLDFAIAGGARMVIMSAAFVILFAVTRAQDLTTALVTQCRIPYEFAFLFTASLRFVPDLLAESKAVQEAQACRGYDPKGSIINRFVSYLSIVQPLVLRSVSRSETMAMSLELRGFNAGKRSFLNTVSLGMTDYLLFALMTVLTVILTAYRFGVLL